MRFSIKKAGKTQRNGSFDTHSDYNLIFKLDLNIDKDDLADFHKYLFKNDFLQIGFDSDLYHSNCEVAN